MKKATKADIFYIQTNPEGLDVPGLVKVTGLTNTQVNKIIASKPEVQTVPANTSKEPTQFQKNAISKTQKGNKGVFIMTEGASQVGDAAKEQNRKKDTSSYICKVR